MTAILQPSTPTLDLISTNDKINYKGVLYPVNNVVSGTKSGGGIYSAVIQISVVTTNDVTLNLSNADTTVQNLSIDANQVQHVTWKQTKNA
jgi:predicted outer membrane repeat protein